MDEPKKKETKWEYAVLENGKRKLIKVTEEVVQTPKKSSIEKKDKIDLILRLISLLAIAVPVILFYLQSKSQIENQKSLYEFETMVSSSVELHSLLNTSVLSDDYAKSQNKIFYELKTKIKLSSNSRIDSSFNELERIERLYYYINAGSVFIDSLYYSSNFNPKEASKWRNNLIQMLLGEMEPELLPKYDTTKTVTKDSITDFKERIYDLLTETFHAKVDRFSYLLGNTRQFELADLGKEVRKYFLKKIELFDEQLISANSYFRKQS